ncbi:MAG: type II toxin-antitoxin system RelE/ParE family toxin [Sumerlaeia bacterium]
MWTYTFEKWSENQADEYIHSLYDFLNTLPQTKSLWKVCELEQRPGIHFCKYKHHVIFFMSLGEDEFEILTILHEKMNLPNRIISDLKTL